MMEDRTMATQHEDKTHPCRIVGCPETTQASRRDRALGATWTCAVHRRILTLSARERTQLRELSGLIQQGQLAIDAAGWLTQVPPKSRPPHPVAHDDDGFPRYIDTASPHGQTIRPGVDTLIGDDPRLDKYRGDEVGE
jgi:hypothetical protein